MNDEYDFITLSPFHINSQHKRLENILRLKQNINYTISAFSTYISAGSTLANSLENISKKFLECGSFSSDPTISNIASCISYFRSALSDHFSQVEKSIIEPLQNFVRGDIGNCERLYKEQLIKRNNYFSILERMLTPKKNEVPSCAPIRAANTEAALSNFEFQRSLELVERKNSYELTATVCIYEHAQILFYKNLLHVQIFI